MEVDFMRNWVVRMKNNSREIQGGHKKDMSLIKTNKGKKLNSDLSMSVYKNIEIKKKILPVYHKSSGSAGRNQELRSITPNYKVAIPSYKSKLWDSKRIYNNSGEFKTHSLSRDLITKYLTKSGELYQRARNKELNLGKWNYTIDVNTEEEIGDMLIDSILYKVNVLQNI